MSFANFDPLRIYITNFRFDHRPTSSFVLCQGLPATGFKLAAGMVFFAHQLANIHWPPALILLIEKTLGRSHGRVAIDALEFFAIFAGFFGHSPVLVGAAQGRACACLGLATTLL